MSQPDTDSLFFTDKHGAVYKVPANEAGMAEKSGWKPASEADMSRAAAKRAAAAEAGSAGGMIKTGLESAASGAFDAATAIPQLAIAGADALGVDTHGLGNQISGRKFLENVRGVAGELGGGGSAEASARQYAEDSRLRAQVNPMTATGATVGGQLLGGALITGGAGALGAEATSALGGGIGARIAGAGVRMGAEGAVLGGVQAKDQAYLEDRELTGQQVLASAGLTGLLGAGLGVATKGLGEVFGAVGSRLTGGAGRAAGAAVAGEAETVGSKVAGGAERAGETEASSLQRLLGTSDSSLDKVVGNSIKETPLPQTADYVREGLRDGDLNVAREAAHEEATKSLTKATNDALATTRQLAESVDNKAWKVEQVASKAETFAPDALEQTQAKAAAIRADVVDAIEQAGKDAPQVLKGLASRLDAASLTIQGAEDPAKAYVAMDQIRRDLAATSRTFWQSARQTNNVDTKSLYEAMGQKIGSHYDDTWKFLMDHGTWGEQGAAQEEVNTARAALIKAEKYAMPRFAEKVGDTYEGTGRTSAVWEANDGSILNAVKRMGTTEGAFAERRLRQYLDASHKFAEAAEKYGLSDADKAAAAAVKANAVNFEKALTTASEKVGAVKQAETYLDKVKGGGSPLGGGLAGAAASFVMNPAKSMAQRVMLEQTAEKFAGSVTKSLDGFFDVARGTVPKAETLAKTSYRASREGVPAALAAFQGKWATPEEAYRKRFEQLNAATDNYGEQIRSAVARKFGDVATDDPHLTMSAVSTATNAAQFLQSKFTTPAYNFNQLTPLTNKPTPSRAEIMGTARYWTAVDKPMTVLEDLKRGTVTREQVEALQTVYPKLYGWIRQQTAQRIADMDRKGERIPLSQRVSLDILLDLNGAGEPALSPAFAAKYGPSITTPAQDKPSPRPRPGPSTASKRLETGTSSMLGGQ